MSSEEYPVNVWFEEIFKGVAGTKFAISDYIYSGKSEFQKIDIFETPFHGRLLAHDGMVMATEKDEFIYHDMITHPAMFVHPKPTNVLIIGGGDGGTAREVLRHSSVEKCTMVEIDGMVVEACRQHLPQTASELDNPKLTLKIDDGINFVRDTTEKFDVVIVDSSDPIGPATPLFNEDFYKNVFACLTDDGIVVSQAESPYYDMPMQKKLVEIIAGIFPKVHLLNYSNLSYPGGFWTFSFASKQYCPFADFDPKRVNESGLEFKYYNSQLHYGAFCIPEFMKREHGDRLSPLPPLTT